MLTRQLFWIASFLTSTCLIVVTINHLVETSKSYHPETSQLASNEQVNTYLNNHWVKTKQSKDTIPTYIKTGLFIQSIDWVDANTFNVSGYVWQHYPHTLKGLVNEGVVFPEAVDFKQELKYRVTGENQDTVGWEFEGKITQKFDYTKYPFDHKTVRLRLWHVDFSQQVLLTPDLEAYDSTKPADKFGIDPDLSIGGYDIIESFYRYRHHKYDTNFGFYPNKEHKNFPELYFNVVIKRNALDALIINVLPLIIVLILCFSSLLSITFDPEKREIYNFRFLEILTQCGALFFVILLAHIHLREILRGISIVYLEYMYLMTYLAIIYVAINAFLVVHAELTNFKFYKIVRYEDNLLPKILFLPFFSLAAYFISIYFF